MEETQEYRDGVLRETYRDAFIRGNNGKETATDVMSAHFRRNDCPGWWHLEIENMYPEV